MKRLTVKKNNSKCAAFLWALLAWGCVMVIVWLALATFSMKPWAEFVAWERKAIGLWCGVVYLYFFVFFWKYKVVWRRMPSRLIRVLVIMLCLSVLGALIKQIVNCRLVDDRIATMFLATMFLMLMVGEIILFVLIMSYAAEKRPKS